MITTQTEQGYRIIVVIEYKTKATPVRIRHRISCKKRNRNTYTMGPREVYDVTGDSEAAMRLLVSGNNNNGSSSNNNEQQIPQDEYNCLLLAALATTTTTNSSTSTNENSLLDESLEDARKVVLNSYSTSNQLPPKRRKIIEEWILAYNRGLVLLSKGKVEESIRESWAYLQPIIVTKEASSSGSSSSQQQQQPPLELACRMGFLILEGMLTLYPTRIHGRTAVTSNIHNYDEGSSFDLGLLDEVLSWLTENVENTKAPQPTTASDNNNNGNSNNQDGNNTALSPDPQLKFLLSLYNSRVDFFERTTGDSTTRDKHMRSARKELKQAMEIFQHKLRPSSSQSASSGGGNNDAISLASVSSYSEEVAAATAGHNNNNSSSSNNNNNNDASSVGKQGNSPTPDTTSSSSTPLPQPVVSSSAFNNSNRNLSRILQGQNQVALNLKANSEQLKGNVKKSLILCGEAQSFNNHTSVNPTSSGTSSSNSSYYDAIHQNNLGIVYETSGKSHLALHAFSKAVRSANSCSNSNSNARFESDGTARPDVTLHVLNNAAVCALKSRNYVAAYECYAIGLATSNSWRKRPRTWLRLSEACIGLNTKVKKERAEGATQCSKVEVDGKASGVLLTDTIKYNDDKIVKALPALASSEDLKEIRNHALMRARMALEKAIELFGEDGANPDDLALQSARLSLAYVSLEERNFKKALKYSMLVLEGDDEVNSNETTKKRTDDDDNAEAVRRTMIKRHKATARMYASEAKASLGDAMASMKILVGDGKDDAFDRLSSDLGGVTIGMASGNAKAKARLAKAQTMVRCSASAASAALGNVAASKQLAMSAQAMENSYSPSREGTSQARKALIYCMLREGNHGAALTLLRSAR